MKPYYSFLLLSTIALLLAASVGCKQQQPAPKAYIQITDSSMAGSNYYLVNSENFQSYPHYYKIKDSATADSNGMAAFTFKTDSNEFISVLDDRKYPAIENVAIKPGDTLYYHRYSRDSSEFRGALSSQVLYHEQYSDSFFSMDAKRKDSRCMAWPYDSFHNYITERKNQFISFLSDFNKEHDLNEEYLAYKQNDIDLWYGNKIARYLGYHNYYATGNFKRIPADSIGFSYRSYIDQPAYSFNHEYREMVDNFIDEQYYLSTKDLPDSLKYKNSFNKRISLIKSHLDSLNQDIAFAQLASSFRAYVDEDNFFDRADSLLAYFKDNKTSNVHLDYFRDRLNSYKSIAPGKPAPPLAFPDTTGSLVALSDFSGKVVYLDFWGTWCGPCIAAIPKLKTLYDTLATNDDVVFLNIAMEGGENYLQNWKDFLSDRDYYRDNVVHLVCEEQFNNEKLDPYLINAAPTYMLIDQEGKIVKTRGPYPTQAKEEIRKLLKEES